MLIVMHHDAPPGDVDEVIARIGAAGLRAAPIPGSDRTAIGVLGNTGYIDEAPFRGLPGIREIIHVTKPYKLVGRDFHPEDTEVAVGRARVRWGAELRCDDSRPEARGPPEREDPALRAETLCPEGLGPDLEGERFLAREMGIGEFIIAQMV